MNNSPNKSSDEMFNNNNTSIYEEKFSFQRLCDAVQEH